MIAHGGQLDERAAGLPAIFEDCVTSDIEDWSCAVLLQDDNAAATTGFSFCCFGPRFGARLAFPMTRRKEKELVCFIIR